MTNKLATLLVLSLMAVGCGARFSPAGEPSFQQKFVTNAQKTYIVLTVLQSIEQDQFIKGNIPAIKHRQLAIDIQVALTLTFDVEQLADALPEGKAASDAVFNLSKAVAKIVDDIAQLKDGASPELVKKVSAAETAFKVLFALFAGDGSIQLGD